MRLQVGIGGQDVLGDRGAELLRAVGRALADDLDLEAAETFHHAVDAVVERRHARNAFEDADLVAVLQHRLEILAGDPAAVEVVGRDQRRLALPVRNAVVDQHHLDAGRDRLVERGRDGRIDRRDGDPLDALRDHRFDQRDLPLDVGGRLPLADDQLDVVARPRISWRRPPSSRRTERGTW